MQTIRNNFSLVMLAAIAIWQGLTHANWGSGFLAGAATMAIVMTLIDRYMGTEPIYRRWYLMCRNELEKIDSNNHVLQEIGPRRSKRESWENV